MPFGPFLSKEQIEAINAAQRRNAAVPKTKPQETQSQKTKRINDMFRTMATPSAAELGGAAGMMSGRPGIGSKTPPTPQALESGMTNNSDVTPVVPKGGTSPSFRAAVEQGADGGIVPGTLPASTVDNMEKSTELERYKVFEKANPGLAKNVKEGQAGYEEIQAILKSRETGMSAEDILAGKTETVPTGRNTEAPVPGDIPQKGTAMGSSNVNLTPATKPEGGKFTSVALAGTEGGAQQRDLTAGVPSVEPIADALDQSRAVTVDQSPTGKEFFNKYFNRTFGR